MSRQFEDFKKIICEFNFDNTYKAAWAKAIIDLSSELPIAKEETEITLYQIAEKFSKYYWNLLIINDFPQSANSKKPPEVVTTIKSLIEVYYENVGERNPEFFENAKLVLPKKQLETTLQSVISTLKKDVSYRFLILDREATDVYAYAKGDASLWISSSLLQEIRDDKQFLLELVHYRWGRIMDLFNGELVAKKETIISEEQSINRDIVLKYEKMLGLKNVNTSKRKIKRVRAVRKGTSLSVFELEKLVKEHKNIGRILITAYAMDNEFDDIHLQAIKELRKGINSFYGTRINNEIVFISLTIIALENYDGNFYEHVNELYEELVEEYGSHRLESQIRATLRALSDNEEYETGRLINSVIKNTLVPLPFLGNYFEFCYDIYKTNFSFSVPDTLTIELKDVFNGIKYATATEGDGLILSGINKTYKLIRTTKQIISEAKDVDDLVWLTGKIIEIIDHYYWNGKARTPNLYFRKGLQDWAEKYEQDQESKEEEGKHWRAQWACHFALSSDGRIVLRTPPHKINKSFDWESIRVFVFNGGKLVKECERLDIRQVLGYYQIQPQEIIIENPLGHLIYKVIAGSEELYSSLDRLARGVLVFDESGNEIANHTDYEGTAFICSSLTDIGHTLSENEYYHLSERVVVPGDHFNYGNEGEKVFLFSDSLKPTLVGEKNDGCYAVKMNSNKKVSIYKSIDSLRFELSNNALPLITVNNNELTLDRNAVERLVMLGKTRWTIPISLLDSGEYDIAVFSCQNGQKTNIKRWSVCVDPSFRFSFIQTEASPSGCVNISSSFIDKASKEYKVSFEAFDEKQFGFFMNGKQWYWLLPLDFPIYRLDGGPWLSMTSNHLWIEDLSVDSRVELYHSCNCVIPRTPDYEEFEEVEIKNHASKEWPFVEIGFLLNHKDQHTFIDLFFMGDNWEIKNQLRCYNKLCVDQANTNIAFDETTKSLTIEPAIIGRGEWTLEIKQEDKVCPWDINDENCFKQVVIPDIQSFVPYSISFYQERRRLLGVHKELVETIEKRFFCTNDFINRTFQIRSVEYDNSSSCGTHTTCCLLNNTYLTFDDFEEGIYRGTLYYKTLSGEERKLQNINPVYIEVCSEIYGDTIDLAIVKPMKDTGSMKTNFRKGDGLLLKVPSDEWHKGEIIDGMDNDNAPDIYTYHMTV